MGSSRPKVLISASRLRARVRALGRRIRRDYRHCEPVLVGVLQGSFIFMADLVRAIELPLRCDFLRMSSYGEGRESSGRVRLVFGAAGSLRGKDVILVEDIVDTGATARRVLRLLRSARPRSLRLCALLHKPECTRIPVRIDYLGFRIPNRFVVGYGLDFAGLYRNLPYLAALEAADLEVQFKR
ncbi:MAG: hypoxanthine phosphoribosyltransferase [Planctomycetota bacterium]